ncbi:hypothetical protein ACFPLB_08665 [Aquamicrobium segne]|uniref:Uncharacterized protein n=1 Tax=Aquamicrobium segne TaxID=469547 RepID=A0ABW0GWX4_9HYPH
MGYDLLPEEMGWAIPFGARLYSLRSPNPLTRFQPMRVTIVSQRGVAPVTP